jgi:transposase
VSDKTTHVCVVDADGAVLKRDVVASDPEVLAKWLDKHCPGLARVVLETGPLSTFLYHGLTERSIPVEMHLRSACQRRIGGSR